MIRRYPLSTYATFSEKLTFLTPRYAHVRVRTRGLEMLFFPKILRTYLMDDPLALLASICVLESNLIFSIPMFGATFHRPIVTLR